MLTENQITDLLEIYLLNNGPSYREHISVRWFERAARTPYPRTDRSVSLRPSIPMSLFPLQLCFNGPRL